MSTSTENISDDMSSNTEEKSVMSVTNVEHAENLEELEKMVNSPSYVLFDGECIRKKSNWSKSGNEYKFDTPDFDGKILLNQMKIRSPKLHELMKNIAKLDRQDQKKYGKQFKHFIFSDLKSGSHGAKLLASAFIAKGMTLGYASTLKEKAKNKEEKNESILPDIFSSKPEEKNVTQEKKTLAAKEKAEADKVAKEKVEADKAAAQEKAVADKAASEASSESEETSESEENAESAVSSLTLPSVPYTGPTLESIRNSLPTVESIENTVNSIVNPKTEEEKEVEEEEKQLESEEENNENMVKGGAKKYEKIELLPDETLLETTGSNFYLLSSVSVYEQSLSVAMKKEMLKKFNHRPDNVHGELVRFIIMDSGFKEGIDLFDVKYIHIFEPQTTAADQKQVIGRGTRTCGQKGLVFQPNKGWPLYVFNYDISISKEHQSLFQGSTTSIELYLKAMNIDLRLMTLTSEMERMAIYGSIDYDLNKNIHNFKRATKEDDDSSVAETITGTSESVSGGAKRRIVIRDDLPPIEIGQRSEASQLLSSKVASLPENFGQPQNANIVGQGAFTPPTTNFKGDHRSPEKFEEELAIHNELHNNKNHKPVRVPDFKEIRGHIKEKYGEFSWDAVKMENLCGYAGPNSSGGRRPPTELVVGGVNAPLPVGEEKVVGGKGTIIEYTPTQDFIRHYFTPSNPYKGMLLYHSVGTGKCHAKDTPILMFDGTIKMVQDVIEGDELMGDDSTPRKVLSLANGHDDMYDIVPVKGDKYTVNSEHILCLKYSGKGAIIDMSKSQPNLKYKTTMINNKTFKIMSKSFHTREEAESYLKTFSEEDRILEIEIKDYLKLSESLKRDLKGYRKGVEFLEKHLSFDPYIMGIWLGDGCKREPVICNQDATILKYIRDKCGKYGLLLNYQSGYSYRLSKDGTTKRNKFVAEINKYNLQNNKHIPYDYKCNSRENRLQLLAGILDSDGSYCEKGKTFEISQKSDILANDILFLVRSLGFAAYLSKGEKSCMYNGEKKTGLYNRITISGNNLDEIPTKVKRKRAEKRLQIKDVLITGVKVSYARRDEYFGFCIDGNRRYLMGDFTVTHNTCSAIAAATSSFEPEGYTILWVTRTTLKNDIWKNMFDQVCNERIRQAIIEGKEIPDEQAKRMRMLSPSWKIRPMSYKQFSNLVSKQNSYYKELVKINGQEDPLRKTLIIIDEAHKLYGGGDLSSLERPDMEALHKSIMNSYLVSGHESVRLLLMTATPITQDPFELVKLMNLCKLPHQQIPADFPQFSQKYLDEDGKFTGAGEDQFLNQIIGHISYLNREKDARQFSQPVIKQVLVPLVDKHTKEFIDTYDKRLTQQGMDSEIMELKKKIMDENKKLEGDLGDIDTSKFAFLKKKCDNYEEGKAKRKCNQIVRANITNIIKEVKVATKEIRDEIKSIREQIKKIQVLKGEKVSEIKRKLLENPQEFKKYENTLFYQLKYDCSKRITDTKSLTDAVHKHPAIVEIDRQMESLDNQIKELEANFKLRIVAYKNRMKNLQSLLKGDVNELEKSVIRMIIRDEQKEYRRMSRVNKKELGEQIKLTQQTKKIYQKKKHTFLRKIRRTLKSKWSDKMKVEKYKVREEKQMRKTLRKQGQIENDIKHELVKDVVDKYSVGIDKDLEDLQEQMAEFKREKEAKEAEKAVKMQQKEAEKAVKMQERAEKQQQKEAERAQKQQQKETERAEKAALRETIKNQKIEAKNLTRKNNK